MTTTDKTRQTLTQQLAACDREWGWEYSPFTGQDEQEIPAYQIFDQHGNAIADTNDEIADPLQWEIAMLLPAAGEGKAAPRASTLPPDPERMNGQRAAWAEAALWRFREITGTDGDDALGDLLCDLMHWADRERFDFTCALDRARDHYTEETTDVMA